jgi:hypothetical protein
MPEEIKLLWNGEGNKNNGLINKKGLFLFFHNDNGSYFKRKEKINEVMNHYLIKSAISKWPSIITNEKPILVAKEVKILVKTENVEKIRGIIDVMILEDILKAAFIEVKSGSNIKKDVEKFFSNINSGNFKKVLFQVAKHMKYLKHYFDFNEDKSRYLIVYPIKEDNLLKEDLIQVLNSKNFYEINWFIKNIDSYIEAIEITKDYIAKLASVKNRHIDCLYRKGVFSLFPHL